jgi:hypothetical protein
MRTRRWSGGRTESGRRSAEPPVFGDSAAFLNGASQRPQSLKGTDSALLSLPRWSVELPDEEVRESVGNRFKGEARAEELEGKRKVRSERQKKTTPYIRMI